MTTKILKSTERGQITLPKEWRDAFRTNSYIASLHKNTLVIAPLQLDSEEDEEVIFNADRDNDGKGISLDSMIKMLTNIIDEQD
ncbi:MAG: AbrB/MazE/SpoVT family DNA-binding domain-containing protein [Candidatus Peribacteraceae bacterium]|nr:AbrB/MazE/SpoVT family DNA-binding domain-containing protein [Candidatus Peribacteraceae bacterium]MBP9850465.1 AbrB/MazE/SpoVT family DNA-binding domain-containing protein [Candidatus Peribacteraceae bacterium]